MPGRGGFDFPRGEEGESLHAENVGSGGIGRKRGERLRVRRVAEAEIGVERAAKHLCRSSRREEALLLLGKPRRRDRGRRQSLLTSAATDHGGQLGQRGLDGHVIDGARGFVTQAQIRAGIKRKSRRPLRHHARGRQHVVQATAPEVFLAPWAEVFHVLIRTAQP